MAPPMIYKHPIKRPTGYLSNARFEGNDNNLRFYVDYPDIAGNPQSISFRLFNDGEDYQEMCIPSAAYDVAKLTRDALVAHLRMASMIAGVIPTSAEWEAALTVEGTGQAKYFQTGIGQTRVNSFGRPNDKEIDIEFQRGTTTNRVTHRVSINEVTQDAYTYSPSTQLLIIPGSVLKAFPSGSHRHDFPGGDILTAQERADIVAYVNALQPWV
jgi:hypothetical protein